MKRSFGRFVLMTSLLLPGLADAALGDRADSITKDSAHLKATRKSVASSTSAYTIEELKMDGTTVHEFLTSDGVIFAVSWRGIARPDLSQLLGSYYSIYTAARESSPHARRQAVVTSNNLVVRHGGHMRDLRGQAVLTNLVPDGVKVEDLQ